MLSLFPDSAMGLQEGLKLDQEHLQQPSNNSNGKRSVIKAWCSRRQACPLYRRLPTILACGHY